ncbi:endonuclease/exonuclease/phosphatase [Nonomuraea sp. NN258]|uniref:endonuclease/exonuclease/phosphatase family protein n=1 Tax=Nonomuraea antri TaxID=2730852 RepID=UPI0015687C1D|nr:endonuclease/exonuclease/phosphatase family protein [Nonomuraea antri]NRQ37835.1 endonuclease/exonuclease/phosphatase [Nonomuraea antri]
MTARVATYNVRGLRESVPALLRVIRGMRPDVLCVQEAPRFLRWRSRRRELARAAGLNVATPGRLGGVAVLTGPRARVLHAESHVLKVFTGLEVRALAVAVVEIDGVRLAAGSLHLDLHQAARMRHTVEALAHLERAAARFGAAAVIGADVNEQAHQPVWRYLAGRLTDCYAAAPAGAGPTFPAAGPRARVDSVFATRGITVEECGVPGAEIADLAGASDHLPVLARLRVGP